MTTTLNKIKSHGPCAEGWATLLAYLGKTEADDEPLGITTILDSNGLNHAIWALRAVEGHDREIRLYAADCAERVLPIFEAQYPGDGRPRKAIQATRDYAEGRIDAGELEAARAAAEAAAWAAWRAAAWAAQAAAWAARTAAWADAQVAAWAVGVTERTWQAERLRYYCGEVGA